MDKLEEIKARLAEVAHKDTIEGSLKLRELGIKINIGHNKENITKDLANKLSEKGYNVLSLNLTMSDEKDIYELGINSIKYNNLDKQIDFYINGEDLEFTDKFITPRFCSTVLFHSVQCLLRKMTKNPNFKIKYFFKIKV